MRADRLLSMLMLLHTQRRMTALELAEQLEVSERTVYRDIKALGIAGIPIYTQTGTNGGIFLDEKYRVSLNGLSKSDVLSLFASGEGGSPLADLGLTKTNTLLKLFTTLPSIHQQEVERLRQRVYIDPMNWFQISEAPSLFPLLQQAVWEDWLVKAIYQPVEGTFKEQVLEAYALVAKANIWYLAAKKTGGEMRTHRISRFKAVVLMDSHFERDQNFDLVAYWKTACQSFESLMKITYPPYQAILRVHPQGFWYFPSWLNGRYEQMGEPDDKGWITLQVIFDSLDDAHMRVLSLGTRVEVLEPVELHQAILRTAQAIVNSAR